MTLEIFGPVVSALLKSSVLVLATAVLVRRRRTRSAALRSRLWLVAIGGLLALPLLEVVLPAWSVPVLPASALPEARLASSADPSIRGTLARRAAAPPQLTPEADARRIVDATAQDAARGLAPPSPETARPPVGTLLGWLWAAGALVILGRFATGTVLVSRAAQRTPQDVSTRSRCVVHRAAQRIGLGVIPRILRGPSGSMPIVWGLFRPSVVLPREAAGWSTTRLEVVLLHELAHVKRRDCLTQPVACLACAVYWFNPLTWFAFRRLIAEREAACDEMVLATGIKGSEYARHLLDVARSARLGRGAWALVPMARRSQLEARLRAILDPAAEDRPSPRAPAAAGLALTAGLVLPLATVHPVLRPSEPTRHGRPATMAEPESVSLARPTAARRAALPADRMSESSWTGVLHKPAEDVSAQASLTASAGESVSPPQTSGTPARPPADSVGPTTDQAAAQDALTRLLQDLRSDDVGTRRRAASHLGGLGDVAAVPALIDALRDPDAGVRRRAAGGLEDLRDTRAIPDLIATLTDPDARVRRRTISALDGLDASSAVPALMAILDDPDAGVRRQAVAVLGDLGDPAAVAGLVGALGDPSVEVRQRVASALGDLGNDQAVPGLVEALKDGDATVRQRAASALGDLDSVAAVPALVAALRDASVEVRRRAASALGDLGTDEVVPGLVEALKDGDATVRQRAVSALGDLESVAAVPALVAALQDSQVEMRRRAVSALADIGDRTAVPAVVQVLGDEDVEVRRRAVSALGDFGDVTIVPDVVLALADVDVDVRRRAASTLGDLADPRAVEALVVALQDSQLEVRARAISALEDIGDRRAVLPLAALVTDGGSAVRRRAIAALEALGDPAAIPALTEALEDPDVDVREGAQRALRVLEGRP